MFHDSICRGSRQHPAFTQHNKIRQHLHSHKTSLTRPKKWQQGHGTDKVQAMCHPEQDSPSCKGALPVAGQLCTTPSKRVLEHRKQTRGKLHTGLPQAPNSITCTQQQSHILGQQFSASTTQPRTGVGAGRRVRSCLQCNQSINNAGHDLCMIWDIHSSTRHSRHTRKRSKADRHLS